MTFLNYTFKSCSSPWPYHILQLILLLWLTTAVSLGSFKKNYDFVCSDGPTVMEEFTRLARFLSVLPLHCSTSKLLVMCSNQQFSYICPLIFVSQSLIHSQFSCLVLFFLQIQSIQSGKQVAIKHCFYDGCEKESENWNYIYKSYICR